MVDVVHVFLLVTMAAVAVGASLAAVAYVIVIGQRVIAYERPPVRREVQGLAVSVLLAGMAWPAVIALS